MISKKGWSTIKNLLKITSLFSFAVLVLCFVKKDDLPGKETMSSRLLNEPSQVVLEQEPFTRSIDDRTYTVYPRYSYELYGLVVSEHDTDSWMDISHEYDSLNTKDICVIWGNNLKYDMYQHVDYWSGDFTCYYRYGESAFGYGLFDDGSLSNNHLLPDTQAISDQLEDVAVGDQIHIKGMLVDYSTTGPNGTSGSRNTSASRTDNDCEIIYTTDFEILVRGNLVYRTGYNVSLLVFLLSTGLLTYFVFFRFK